MNDRQISSWQATNDELWALASVVSALIGGPLGPLGVWGLRFAYNRRDLIFSQFGTPVQAYTAERSPLRLTSLATPNRAAARAPAGMLSINTPLTGAARQLGLRNGDPVSVVLAGHQYVQARSGLVVPTRIGERVEIWAPNGNYSVAALGSRRDALFTTPDPYSTVTGRNVLLTGRHQLDLSLTARNTVAPLASRATRPPAAQPKVTWLTTTGTLGIPANGNRHRCPQCAASYRWPGALKSHLRREHGTLWEQFLQFLDDL